MLEKYMLPVDFLKQYMTLLLKINKKTVFISFYKGALGVPAGAFPASLTGLSLLKKKQAGS